MLNGTGPQGMQSPVKPYTPGPRVGSTYSGSSNAPLFSSPNSGAGFTPGSSVPPVYTGPTGIVTFPPKPPPPPPPGSGGNLPDVYGNPALTQQPIYASTSPGVGSLAYPGVPDPYYGGNRGTDAP